MRMLTNLKGVYLKAGDDERALGAVERLLMVTPTAPAENRARGVLLGRLGWPDEAAIQLETYLRIAPNAPDTVQIERMVRDLREGRDPSEIEGL